MKRKGQIIVGLALILIFILMALAAPLLAPMIQMPQVLR